jgi:hypothetical protein
MTLMNMMNTDKKSYLTDVTHGWYFSRLPRRAPELLSRLAR